VFERKFALDLSKTSEANAYVLKADLQRIAKLWNQSQPLEEIGQLLKALHNFQFIESNLQSIRSIIHEIHGRFQRIPCSEDAGTLDVLELLIVHTISEVAVEGKSAEDVDMNQAAHQSEDVDMNQFDAPLPNSSPAPAVDIGVVADSSPAPALPAPAPAPALPAPAPAPALAPNAAQAPDNRDEDQFDFPQRKNVMGKFRRKEAYAIFALKKFVNDNPKLQDYMYQQSEVPIGAVSNSCRTWITSIARPLLSCVQNHFEGSLQAWENRFSGVAASLFKARCSGFGENTHN
jgi:hypothetical protein